MVTPRRIQRKRVKGYKLPANTVCVTRPSKWGNPYRVTRCGNSETCDQWVVVHGETLLTDCMPREKAAAWAVKRFAVALKLRLLRITPEQVRAELRGNNLACWCKEGESCHADVLLSVATS